MAAFSVPFLQLFFYPVELDACTGTMFTDIRVSSPFCSEIEWLASNVVIGGYSDRTFKPTSPVSRQAFAAFMSRLHGLVES